MNITAIQPLTISNNPKTRPYIGSYLGISEPDNMPQPIYKQTLVELELHILKADLSVRIVTMVAPTDGSGNEPEQFALQHIAWVDREAIAFVVYRSYQDKATGKFIRESLPDGDLGLRTGRIQWTWFDPTTGEKDERGPFIPDHLAKYRK